MLSSAPWSSSSTDRDLLQKGLLEAKVLRFPGSHVYESNGGFWGCSEIKEERALKDKNDGFSCISEPLCICSYSLSSVLLGFNALRCHGYGV